MKTFVRFIVVLALLLLICETLMISCSAKQEPAQSEVVRQPIDQTVVSYICEDGTIRYKEKILIKGMTYEQLAKCIRCINAEDFKAEINKKGDKYKEKWYIGNREMELTNDPVVIWSQYMEDSNPAKGIIIRCEYGDEVMEYLLEIWADWLSMDKYYCYLPVTDIYSYYEN